MIAIGQGVAAARRRVDARWTTERAGVTLGVVLAAALVLRFQSGSDAADVVLGGAVFGVCIPLFALRVVTRACRHGRLDAALFAERRGGERFAGTALGLGAVAMARSALVAAGLGVLGALAAQAGNGEGFTDALRTAWIGALAGAAYAALFLLGSQIGRSGGGRVGLLILDAVLGSTEGAVAVPWPRGHVRSLLGGARVFDLPVWQSAFALCLLGCAYLTASLARGPR